MPTVMNGDTFYNTAEACNFLSVSRETLNNYVRRLSLKRYKKGLSTTNYYRLSDLKSIKDERESFREAQDVEE